MVSAIPTDLYCFFRILIVLAWLIHTERKKSKDNLPILATYWSGTLVMLSSKVNGPIAHGSTR